MKKTLIELYRWEGKFGPIKIKTKCGECNLSEKIIEDVAKEFKGFVSIKKYPWLNNWYKLILKGGWHAPIVLLNGKILSQGKVIDRDILRGNLVREIFKEYKIDKNNHIFTLPGCRYCREAKSILKRNNIKFIEHNILKENIEMQKMLALVLGKIHPIEVPQIFLKGKWIKGGTEKLKELERQRRL